MFCPTSPYSLLSVGRLFRECPHWHWKLSRTSSHSLALRALDESGALVIDAVTDEDLFLWKCLLGPSPRAAVNLPRGADSQAQRRAAHAQPAVVPAATPLVDGLPVPASVSSDPPKLMCLFACLLVPTTGSLRGGIELWGTRACVSCAGIFVPTRI